MSELEELVPFSTKISGNLHRDIREAAANSGQKVYAFAEQALTRAVESVLLDELTGDFQLTVSQVQNHPRMGELVGINQINEYLGGRLARVLPGGLDLFPEGDPGPNLRGNVVCVGSQKLNAATAYFEQQTVAGAFRLAECHCDPDPDEVEDRGYAPPEHHQSWHVELHEPDGPVVARHRTLYSDDRLSPWVYRDYALVRLSENPLDRDRRVLVLAGLSHVATALAVSMALSRRFRRQLADQLAVTPEEKKVGAFPAFEAVLPVIIRSGVPEPVVPLPRLVRRLPTGPG